MTELERRAGVKQAFAGQDRNELLAMEQKGTTEVFALRGGGSLAACWQVE